MNNKSINNVYDIGNKNIEKEIINNVKSLNIDYSDVNDNSFMNDICKINKIGRKCNSALKNNKLFKNS